MFFHLVVWETSTKKIFTVPEGYMVGELARIAYDSDVVVVRPISVVNLPKRHTVFNFDFNKKTDVLTFGDSFSAGGGGGLNNFYQDYIATYSDANVVNVRNYKNNLNAIDTLIYFINSGLIDKIKPKHIILESVQRECMGRFAKKIDFNKQVSLDDLRKFYSKCKDKKKPKTIKTFQKVDFISVANYKYLLYKLLYCFNDRAFMSYAYRMKLKNGDYFLVYKHDIKQVPRPVNSANVALMNNNLNRIGQILEQKNIKFHFLPAPDRYTLYYDFFVDNPYPKNNFFELLYAQSKSHYNLIDTKAILQRELNGELKYIYTKDDNHWNYRASEAIFRQIKFD